MKVHWKQASTLVAAAVIGTGFGFAGAAGAADYGTPPANQAAQPGKTMAPAESKIMAPSKTETADAAFKKLDASGKGYVSMNDAKAVPGFDKSFQANDADHDGKLTLAEFKKAWQDFTGNKS